MNGPFGHSVGQRLGLDHPPLRADARPAGRICRLQRTSVLHTGPRHRDRERSAGMTLLHRIASQTSPAPVHTQRLWDASAGEHTPREAAMRESNPWRCAVCDSRYVVPSMARQCEAAHEAEAA